MAQIRHVSGRAFNKILKEKGIDAFNGAQGKILYVLWEKGSMPISQIKKFTSLANTTLTGMLDHLEKSGLVTRAINPANRRQVIVSLTPLAESLKNDCDDVSRITSEIFYAGFQEEEIIAFENMLRRILRNYTERGY